MKPLTFTDPHSRINTAIIEAEGLTQEEIEEIKEIQETYFDRYLEDTE